MQFIRYHHISFKNAFRGLFWAFTTQPNFRIHGFFSLLAITAGFILKITSVEMTILVLTIVFGMGTEMVNTAIESVTDMITSQWREEAKIAKDVAAGMMLLSAIGAVIVALIIFIPRFWIILF